MGMANKQPPGGWDRQTTTVLLFGLKAVLLVKNCYDWLWAGENVPIIEFLYPIIHMVTLIVLLHYSEQYRLAGLVSSGPVFCTWLMFVIVGSVEFGFSLYTTDNNNVSRRSTTDFMAFLITLAWWPLCCLQLLLHLFTETAAPSKWEDEVNSSPEPRASFVSRQLFCWLDPLVWRGHRKPLAERDVFGLEPSLRAKRLFHRWTRERQRQAERGRHTGAPRFGAHDSARTTRRARFGAA
uniref:Transmembrane protein n=1 Tax=Globodera pallida TaxID=36090 RepID=A0A183CDR1_GLOPA